MAHTIFPLAAEFTKRYCRLEESVEDIMAEWMEMAGDAYATRVQVKPACGSIWISAAAGGSG